MAEWLRRLIRNQLEAIPREFESLCCRVFVKDLHLLVFIFWFKTGLWNEACFTCRAYSGARGATDSAADFESGGCGFESRRACFAAMLWAVGLVV